MLSYIQSVSDEKTSADSQHAGLKLERAFLVVLHFLKIINLD